MLHISYRLVFIRVSGVVIFNLLLLIVNMEKNLNLKLRKERGTKISKRVLFNSLTLVRRQPTFDGMKTPAYSMQRGGPICASSTIDGPLFLTLPSQKSCFQNLINIY